MSQVFIILFLFLKFFLTPVIFSNHNLFFSLIPHHVFGHIERTFIPIFSCLYLHCSFAWLSSPNLHSPAVQLNSKLSTPFSVLQSHFHFHDLPWITPVLPILLVTYCCHNKLLQTEGLRTEPIYCWNFIGQTSIQLVCSRLYKTTASVELCFFLKALRWTCFQDQLVCCQNSVPWSCSSGSIFLPTVGQDLFLHFRQL